MIKLKILLVPQEINELTNLFMNLMSK